jgi:hypothetical protein
MDGSVLRRCQKDVRGPREKHKDQEVCSEINGTVRSTFRDHLEAQLSETPSEKTFLKSSKSVKCQSRT